MKLSSQPSLANKPQLQSMTVKHCELWRSQELSMRQATHQDMVIVASGKELVGDVAAGSSDEVGPGGELVVASRREAMKCRRVRSHWSRAEVLQGRMVMSEEMTTAMQMDMITGDEVGDVVAGGDEV